MSPLEIKLLKDRVITPGGLWISDGRYWLTKDRKRAVPDGDPEAKFLLVACAGRTMPLAQAKELGLYKEPAEGEAPAAERISRSEDEPKAEEVAPEAPEEPKQAEVPEDKQAEPPEDKGVHVAPETKRTKSRKKAKKKKKASKRAGPR